MKTAIVYYSMNGNTAFAAEKIASELHADIIELKPKKQYPNKGFRKFLLGGMGAVMADTPELEPYSFDSKLYEQILFGFPVWASTVTPPLRTFIRDNSEGLKGKRIAAFACQSGAGADKAFGKLAECIGIPAFSATLILIDPKDKPKSDTDEKIRVFCDECR